MSEWIKRLTEKYSEVTENQKAALQKKLAKSAASSQKGKDAVTLPKAPFEVPKAGGKQEAMDPVDKKELKGKHADRDDKDIDNDGDADASDEYLHKRRKAITKNTKGAGIRKRIKDKMKSKDEDEVVMNPKGKKDDTQMSQEKVEWTVYDRIIEKREMHMKGATKPEEMHDKSKSSKGAMDMLNTPKDVVDNPEASGDDVKKASQAGPNGKARQNDNKSGDKAIMKKPEDATQKGEG